MEGSESGAVVPSNLEAETWVKIWNFPAEFLFADDISLLVSSFGSVVGTDEDTYEKMQNHLRPSNLRRKLHSSTTFVTIFVRVSVTKPLPSRVAVGSKKGREFIIGLDFDPTPKVCLLCHGAGHFDFECGTDKESVETIAEAGVGFEEVNDVAVEDVGAATSKVSFGDPRVLEVDPLLLPPAPCVSGAADLHAVVGDLVAIQSFSVLEVPPTVEDVLEVNPLCLPPGSMEGSESGVVVPSVLEAETWVKLCNLPAEFLTVDDINLIVSSFASPLGMDEDTAEKVENHKKPRKLRRKLHSRKTFVTICVRISVTKPLPSLVAVGSKKGREYIIRLDFDPTPKVCLLCLGAGHFDFECCSTDKESVEIIAEAGGGLDGFCADFHGEQEAVSTDGLHSYEDATVAEAALMVDSHFLPAASCEFGAAAAPELMPLLPATFTGVQGSVLTEGSESFEELSVLEVDPPFLPPDCCDSLSDEVNGEQGAVTIDEAVQIFSDRFDDKPVMGKDISADLLVAVGDSVTAGLQQLAAEPSSDGVLLKPILERIDVVSCLVDEQVAGANVLFPFEPGPSFVLHFIMDIVLNDYVYAAGYHFGLLFSSFKLSSIEPSSFEDFAAGISSRHHHKWREKTVQQRFLEGDSGAGQGFLGVAIQDADCIGDIFACFDDVQGAVIIDWAVCYGDPPDFEAAQVEDFHNFEQGFFVVQSSTTHHKWRDKSKMQGLFCISFDDLILLQTFLDATFLDQLIFKIQHKWRNKGC